jgi:hypothetical protein
VGVDHAPQPLSGRGLDRVESAEPPSLVEEIETDPIHLQIELAAHREDGITDDLGLEAARRKAPEELVVGILLPWIGGRRE